jgi:transmembrane sensor
MPVDPCAFPDGSDPAGAGIVQAAAEWRARQDAGLTVAEQEAFLRWLEKDPRHAEIFGEMDATWSLLNRVAELSPTELKRATIRDREPLAAAPRRRSWRRRLLVGLAVAASVAIGLWQRPRSGDPMMQFAESTPAEAGILKRVNLPDGSVVRLRADSAIDVRYESGVRRVRLLRGAAHFAVTKDPARAFVVEVKGVDVRAVGTAFSVASQPDAIEVLVTEGTVRVDSVGPGARGGTLLPRLDTGEESVLQVGDRAIVALPASPGPVQAAVVHRLTATALASALAWQERTLAFDAAPLGEIVAAFNRFNRHQLVVADAALADRRFGGSFRADDPEGFLALLAATSDIRLEKRPDETIIRDRR